MKEQIIELLRLAIPILISSIGGFLSVLICTRILSIVSVSNLYVLSFYLPISYFLIALYESLRATLMTMHAMKEAIQNKFLCVSILGFWTIALFLIIFILEKNLISKIFNIQFDFQQPFYSFSLKMLVISFLSSLSILLNTNLYLSGKTIAAMFVSVFSSMSIILMTYLLSEQLRMGLSGYAISTFLSALMSCLISLSLLKQRSPRFTVFKKTSFRTLWGEIRFAQSILMYVGLSYSILFLGLLLVTSILAQFGHDAMAGFGLIYRIQSMMLMPAIALSTAIVILKPSYTDALIVGISLSFAFYLLCSILIIIFKNPIIDFFAQDPKIVENSARYLKYVAPSYCALGPLICYLSTLEQSGLALRALAINSIYLLFAFALSGCFALYLHNDSFLYEGIALANWLGFGLIFILIMKERKYA